MIAKRKNKSMKIIFPFIYIFFLFYTATHRHAESCSIEAEITNGSSDKDLHRQRATDSGQIDKERKSI